MNLNCTDFLEISSYLSDEEIMVQNTARDFSEKEISPIIEDCYEKGNKDDETHDSDYRPHQLRAADATDPNYEKNNLFNLRRALCANHRRGQI